MKILWTREALERLIEIEDFISKDSPHRTQHFVEYLIERGESISENPNIGRTIPELSNPLIRELIIKGYRLVYRLRDDQIDILTVFEGHRLLNMDEIEGTL